MSKYEDLTGQKFHHLTVISDAGFSASGNHQSKCRCDCGNKCIVQNGSLKNATTKSCGDLKNCSFARNIKSVGHTTHGLKDTLEFRIWLHIKDRCYNLNAKHYPDYGGRGITLFLAWINDFQAFYDYLQTLPETLAQFQTRNPGKRATIDRIDNNGNYEPDNIQWATMQIQCQNRRTNVLTKQSVKYIRWEYNKNGKTKAEIFRILKDNYNYQGSDGPIGYVIRNQTWLDITIDKEIAEYQQFGTINGIAIVNDIVTPGNF